MISVSKEVSDRNERINVRVNTHLSCRRVQLSVTIAGRWQFSTKLHFYARDFAKTSYYPWFMTEATAQKKKPPGGVRTIRTPQNIQTELIAQEGFGCAPWNTKQGRSNVHYCSLPQIHFNFSNNFRSNKLALTRKIRILKK
ncbi:hypothetical protein C0J52_03128 [Blattella germanica]|nr:hypothetical protein C0J52_03128 [Blattella germanica]